MRESLLMKEFLSIVQACEAYPYTTRLKKTSRTISLVKICSVFYIDIRNMFYVLTELFDSPMPFEIVGYLRRILFTEVLDVSENGVTFSKELICISFIDQNSFKKIESWVEEYTKGDNGGITSFFSFLDDTPRRSKENMLPLQNLDDAICNAIPFNEPWMEENSLGGKVVPQNCSSICYERAKPGWTNGHKPRGKQMKPGKGSSADRPYVCEYTSCHRAFKRLEHLRRHEKMHTGERPFKCMFPGCRKSFSRSDNLNSHYKTHSIHDRQGIYMDPNKQDAMGEY